MSRCNLARFRWAAVFCFLVLAVRLASAAEPDDYAPLKQRFAAAVAEELAAGVTPGYSVAWVAEGEVVHVAGYGQADWQQQQAATADTIYRAGSISKLFNAVAVMQMVEQDKLDLDAPIQSALPEFSIVVPFDRAKPITLRQLLCHRSGMVREAPVGGYLDPSEPSIEATLASVAGAALVNRPDTRMRYSNVGPTIAGQAVVKASGTSYAEYQQEHLLDPLGMTSSAWKMNDELRPRLAKGRMRIARSDGSYSYAPAPEFELGTLPAGNLYTTAKDLARFAVFMLGGDASAELNPPLLHPASLEMMGTPQLIDDATGFGLGFYVGEFRGRKTLQHGGAVYGFSTVIVAVPEERMGVVVLSNADIASASVRRLANLSLNLLLEKLRGEPLPEEPAIVEVSSEQLAKLAGEYESESYWANLRVEGQSLVGELSGQPIRLSPTSPLTFLANGRIMNDSQFDFKQSDDGSVNHFRAAGQRFTRVEKADEAPPAWQTLVGSYGPEFIPLVVSIRNGHLYGSVENEYEYRLVPLNRVTFKHPPGMYTDEQVVFQLTPDGNCRGAILANQYLPRRAD